MKPFIIAIDGNCGSGKSTLATLIDEKMKCNVFHMDDFYLPFSKRQEDWEMIPGGNMDIDRFEKTILVPAINGDKISYQRYYCREDILLEPVILEPTELVVVEGSYSHHPDLSKYYDLKIFLTCEKDEQARRLIEREGERFRFYQERWIPMEERYYAAFSVQAQADLVIETKDYTVYNDLLEEIISRQMKPVDEESR